VTGGAAPAAPPVPPLVASSMRAACASATMRASPSKDAR
jgi:hypothetical protein